MTNPVGKTMAMNAAILSSKSWIPDTSLLHSRPAFPTYLTPYKTSPTRVTLTPKSDATSALSGEPSGAIKVVMSSPTHTADSPGSLSPGHTYPLVPAAAEGGVCAGQTRTSLRDCNRCEIGIGARLQPVRDWNRTEKKGVRKTGIKASPRGWP